MNKSLLLAALLAIAAVGCAKKEEAPAAPAAAEAPAAAPAADAAAPAAPADAAAPAAAPAEKKEAAPAGH